MMSSPEAGTLGREKGTCRWAGVEFRQQRQTALGSWDRGLRAPVPGTSRLQGKQLIICPCDALRGLRWAGTNPVLQESKPKFCRTKALHPTHKAFRWNSSANAGWPDSQTVHSPRPQWLEAHGGAGAAMSDPKGRLNGGAGRCSEDSKRP